MWTAPAIEIEGNLFALWSNAFFKLTLDESMKSLHWSEVCSSCKSSINSWMLFSILGHHPLSNMLLCLTASSYRIILLHLSQEYSTAEAVIQVAEPSFCCCDKMSVCSASL